MLVLHPVPRAGRAESSVPAARTPLRAGNNTPAMKQELTQRYKYHAGLPQCPTSPEVFKHHQVPVWGDGAVAPGLPGWGRGCRPRSSPAFLKVWTAPVSPSREPGLPTARF